MYMNVISSKMIKSRGIKEPVDCDFQLRKTYLFSFFSGTMTIDIVFQNHVKPGTDKNDKAVLRPAVV